MKATKCKAFLWLLPLLVLAVPGMAPAAEVDVFAEGAYTASDLVVYIYANINTENLCSYGVKLSYDAAKLNVPNAEKNEAVWYFGTSSTKQPYMNPDTSTAGQVLFIGGKLDTGTPAAGVTGTRVLLGKATFSRKDSTIPEGTPETYFGILLAQGKDAPYDNFVTAAGVVKDGSGVAFNTANKVRERGDANADLTINVQDIGAVRYYMTSGGPNNPWKDCNGDGTINVQDIGCIRYIMTH